VPQPTTDLVECQYGDARYLTEKETKLLLNHSPLANFQNPRFGDPCFLICSASSGYPFIFLFFLKKFLFTMPACGYGGMKNKGNGVVACMDLGGSMIILGRGGYRAMIVGK
jgi:hypothetical protein